jgi:predicted DNA-binding transcriptional regulator YafY
VRNREHITVNDAAHLLQITERQVFRLLKAFQTGGPAALVSSRRGRPSNRSYPAALRTEALALITANDADFGSTPACEKLAERHGIALGLETIRRWMIAADLWQERRQKLKRGAPAALPARLRRRTRPDRRLGALLV